MIASLTALLDPHDPALLDAALLRRERRHFHTGQAAAFARLMPWELFNTLPSVEGLNNADLRILQNGRDVFYDMLVLPSLSRRRRRLSSENLQKVGHQGVSMVVNRIQERVPAIAALNAMLERHYRCMSWTNCYASFRRDGAFPPHRDEHDVLVLQLHGEKRWLFHGAGAGEPSDTFPDPARLPPPEAEILLRPGDIMFVPRGEVHRAEVVGEDSLHLSVALLHARGGDVLRWLADLADGQPAGGEDVLPMEAAADRERRQGRLQAMIGSLADGLDLEAFFAARDADREPVRPINFGQSGRVTDATFVLPSLRNRLLPEGLTGIEGDVMAHLLVHDGVSVAALASALPAHQATAVADAVASLARKALVFLGD
jgi:hypothetical protein